MSLRGLFARRAAAPDSGREAAGHVKALALRIAALPDGSEVTASEIVCLDPACPGTETVLLVMGPGERTRAAKIAKPASEITERDVRSALVEAGIGVTG